MRDNEREREGKGEGESEMCTNTIEEKKAETQKDS